MQGAETRLLLLLPACLLLPIARAQRDSELAAINALYQSTEGAGWKEKAGWALMRCSDGDCTLKCDDSSPECPAWAVSGECESNPMFMHTNCANSCGRCGAQLCNDANAGCSEWAQMGECTNNAEFMLTNCPQSCQACDVVAKRAMDPCSRAMITCDEGKVSAMGLRDNSMAGTLPTEIGQLTALDSIHAFNNQISGTLPTQMGTLSKLRILSVYRNRISGALPTQLGLLTMLTRLVLFDLPISAVPTEIGNLRNLELMNMYRTAVEEAELPTQLAKLPSARVLVGEEPDRKEMNKEAEAMAAIMGRAGLKKKDEL